MTNEGSGLGPFAEREYRLLFLGRTSSFLGSAFANVALAFAVLDLTGSKADLGFVLAAGSLPTIVFLLVGGIWADRLPRHHVMVVSNLVSGACQALVAALLFAGVAAVWEIAALAAVRGTAIAFFFPASAGIVPQTVPESLLQQANALLRLSRNATVIVGGALAGVVVAATSPATGIAVDAGTFFLAAAFIGVMHLPAGLRMEARSFTADLSEGWREFSSRTWLWVIVLQFSVVNAVVLGAQSVLGPAIANESLHGAAGWGLVLSAEAAGLAAGGLLMLRLRPRRMLLAATVGMLLTVPLLFGLAVPVTLAAVCLLAFVSGMGMETFGVLWDTTMQQEIPRDRLSRVYSYDALGSWALVPLGLAAVGPISEALGTQATLVGAGLLSLGATCGVLLVRDVRGLRRRDPVAPLALEAAG
jgi:MFS family permease